MTVFTFPSVYRNHPSIHPPAFLSVSPLFLAPARTHRPRTLLPVFLSSFPDPPMLDPLLPLAALAPHPRTNEIAAFRLPHPAIQSPVSTKESRQDTKEKCACRKGVVRWLKSLGFGFPSLLFFSEEVQPDVGGGPNSN